MSRRSHLPISGSDINNKQFEYSLEAGGHEEPPQNGYADPPQPAVKNKGLRYFVKLLLVKSGIFHKDWINGGMEVTDRWNDWYYRNRKYVLISIFALFITLIIITVLYINLFGPGKRISSFDLKYKVKILDLDNQKFREWIKTVDWIDIEKSDLESGVITAPLFLNWGLMNVTVGDLKEVLEINCPLEERECLCLSVFHLGFAANSIILNDFGDNTSSFLIEPKITSQSSQLIKIRIGESKDPIESPAIVSVEYFLESGLKTRRSFEKEHAACILECVKEYKEGD